LYGFPLKLIGVRSPEDIRKGQFVDRYVGELITAEETERRRQQSDIAAKKDVYLFELDKFKDDADRDPSLAETVFVDGEYESGPSRFINHSCDPNLRIFARVGDHATKRFHDLAFFAIKDIPADTELTFDYVDGEDEKLEEEKKDPSQKKEMTRCLCKSKKCRGYLW
jgi:histone-lysine N-methyltransferase SUV39H